MRTRTLALLLLLAAGCQSHQEEVTVVNNLASPDGRIKMDIRFRLFDDGLGFRYEFPGNQPLNYFVIKEELTHFAMADDCTAWWIPGDFDTQEYEYTESRLSEISKHFEAAVCGNSSQTLFSMSGVQTSLLMRTDSGLYVSIHEAAKHHIMVNAHEAVRPTGLCRTYPNLIGNESARGTEYQAFGGTQPAHVTILPFTRLNGGPMDFTPGIFEMELSTFADNNSHVNATIANQLGLYVTMKMLYDLRIARNKKSILGTFRCEKIRNIP